MIRKRHVVECVWRGPSSSPVVHRVVTRFPEHYKDIHTIQFTDGTTMSVDVRPCFPREKVSEIHGYSSLLTDIRRVGLSGFVRVSDVTKRMG